MVDKESRESRQFSASAPSVRWQDSHEKNTEHSTTSSVDEQGFVARQMRRISEHPKISQIQLARKTSKHSITFLRKALTIIASSLLFKIVFAILRLIPISKIIMSVIFYNDCTVEPLIPIYLLVGGILACVRDVANITVRKCLDPECKQENEITLTLVAFLYTVGEFAWFIVGSVFVYMTFGHYQGKESHKPDYCNQVLFIYAFVVTTISYVLLILVFTLSCCTVLVAKCTDTSSPSRPARI